MQIAINEAAKDWGLTCLPYEIRDINPPAAFKVAMEMQAEAERKKRASILDSEAERQAQINVAEGKKISVMLEAQAQAEAILVRAQATNKGLALVSQSIKENGGAENPKGGWVCRQQACKLQKDILMPLES